MILDIIFLNKVSYLNFMDEKNMIWKKNLTKRGESNSLAKMNNPHKYHDVKIKRNSAN